MELVWKLPENQVEAKPWRHKLTVFHCRVLRIGLRFYEFELRSIKPFLRKGFSNEVQRLRRGNEVPREHDSGPRSDRAGRVPLQAV